MGDAATIQKLKQQITDLEARIKAKEKEGKNPKALKNQLARAKVRLAFVSASTPAEVSALKDIPGVAYTEVNPATGEVVSQSTVKPVATSVAPGGVLITDSQTLTAMLTGNVTEPVTLWSYDSLYKETKVFYEVISEVGKRDEPTGNWMANISGNRVIKKSKSDILKAIDAAGPQGQVAVPSLTQPITDIQKQLDEMNRDMEDLILDLKGQQDETKEQIAIVSDLRSQIRNETELQAALAAQADIFRKQAGIDRIKAALQPFHGITEWWNNWTTGMQKEVGKAAIIVGAAALGYVILTRKGAGRRGKL